MSSSSSDCSYSDIVSTESESEIESSDELESTLGADLPKQIDLPSTSTQVSSSSDGFAQIGC